VTQNNSKFREPKRNRQVPRLFFPFGRVKSLACETVRLLSEAYLRPGRVSVPHFPSRSGMTTARTLCNALVKASGSGHLDAVKYFIDEQHVDPSCRDDGSNTPLHAAAAEGQLAVVKYLITEKRCNPMCRVSCGKTPLHYASGEGQLDVIKYLIDEQNVDPSCRDNGGKLPSTLQQRMDSWWW